MKRFFKDETGATEIVPIIIIIIVAIIAVFLFKPYVVRFISNMLAFL